jgi:hypothetical protein
MWGAAVPAIGAAAGVGLLLISIPVADVGHGWSESGAPGQVPVDLIPSFGRREHPALQQDVAPDRTPSPTAIAENAAAWRARERCKEIGIRRIDHRLYRGIA